MSYWKKSNCGPFDRLPRCYMTLFGCSVARFVRLSDTFCNSFATYAFKKTVDVMFEGSPFAFPFTSILSSSKLIHFSTPNGKINRMSSILVKCHFSDWQTLFAIFRHFQIDVIAVQHLCSGSDGMAFWACLCAVYTFYNAIWILVSADNFIGLSILYMLMRKICVYHRKSGRMW